MLNIKQLHRLTLTSWGTSNWTTYFRIAEKQNPDAFEVPH